MRPAGLSPRQVQPRHGSRVRLFNWLPPLALLVLSVPGFLDSPESRPMSVVLTLLLVAPLVFRRRYPIPVFAVTCAVVFPQWWAGGRLVSDIDLLVALCTLLIAFYAVTSRRSIRVAAATALVLEGGVALLVIRWSSDGGWLRDIVLLSGMTAAAGVFGASKRARAAIQAQLRDRADRLERERDQQIALASAAERARIARELHDVVAHHLTVIIALAEGAAAAVSSSPARAAQVMTTVSATGREALADTRRLLGVLRADDAAAQLHPQPDIGDLDALLDQVRAAGLPAAITVTGRHEDLSSALQLTIYRLIQEALTNTLKHAGPGTHADVRLSCTEDWVSVDVRDDGLGSASPAADAFGGVDTPELAKHGLNGMRERVAVWGGELRAGPASPGGWLVSAQLRTRAAVPADTAVNIR